MIDIIVSVREALQCTFLKSAEEANELTAAVKRRRKFTPSKLAQAFILALLLNPKPRHDDIAFVAAASGVDVSPQAIEHVIRRRWQHSLKSYLGKWLSRS
jgi:hypothetical protein